MHLGSPILSSQPYKDGAAKGLVLIEAKAAGLPVVSVDAYGPATVVRPGVDGFLVPNAPEPFAEAIQRVLRDPGLRARQRSLRH